MQALLVLRQSATSGDLHQGILVLRGDLADIGTSRPYDDSASLKNDRRVT